MNPAAKRPLSLSNGRALILVGVLLSAFNLRTAVTSLTPLLDVLGDTFGFGATMTGVFGMVPTAAFALFGVATPRIAQGTPALSGNPTPYGITFIKAT